MWIGFSAVEGAAAGPAPQGGAFSLESCQNWLPGEPHPATAERCVRLGPAGQCNTDLCSAPHSYVCELRPGGARDPGWVGGSACCPGHFLQRHPQACSPFSCQEVALLPLVPRFRLPPSSAPSSWRHVPWGRPAVGI